MHHGDVHKRFTVAQLRLMLDEISTSTKRGLFIKQAFLGVITLLYPTSASTTIYCLQISCQRIRPCTKKILQEYPKGLKNIRFKKMMGLSTLRCLIRRCQESYDFPYDFIRFFV